MTKRGTSRILYNSQICQVEAPPIFETLVAQFASDSSVQIYAVAFAILLACGFGLPMPEDIILFTLGYLSFTGNVTLTGSITVAMAGVLIGDSTIYWIGRIYGERILRFPIFRRLFSEPRLEMVRATFHQNGNVYLFFARFTPGLRAVTFWSAGTFKIPFRTFLLMDGTAALISVPALTYLAYRLGEAFESYLGDVREFIGWLGLGAILMLIAFTIYRRRKLTQKS